MAASNALPCQWTPILPLYTVRSPLPPAIAVASSGAAINDGFCYFCILQTDISSSAYLETFADLRRGVPKRPYITKSIQMAESDGPLKVEDQIRRVPILRLLDCKKRRYIEPLYTRQSSYKLSDSLVPSQRLLVTAGIVAFGPSAPGHTCNGSIVDIYGTVDQGVSVVPWHLSRSIRRAAGA